MTRFISKLLRRHDSLPVLPEPARALEPMSEGEPLLELGSPLDQQPLIAQLRTTRPVGRVSPARWAVVDTETTGLFNADRIVEIAIVTIDPASGTVIDEYDTLINPMRDIGAVGIHGINASMVQSAPIFEEVAAAVAQRLDGAVLVAHNLSFDTRMLNNEFRRLGAELDAGDGICTLRLCGERLDLVCERYGIPLSEHHRALADARATAQLLLRVLDHTPHGDPAVVAGVSSHLQTRTCRRQSTEKGSSCSVLHRVVVRTPYPTSDGAVACYLDMLDWALDDLIMTADERDQLAGLATELGLSSEQVANAHRAYLDVMLIAARRDNLITDVEHQVLHTAASLLGVDDVLIPTVTPTRQFVSIAAEGRVCFTGAMVHPREELEALASNHGLRPISSVTRKCDLLVASDAASMSTKARKARTYDIPIISEAQFLVELHLPLQTTDA